MTDRYFNSVDFAGDGGGGSLIVATRTDNDNPAIFADFAALETYAATPDGTTDANRINVGDQGDAMEVFGVGTLNNGNQVTSITAAYIRLDNEWVSVATNLVGSPGLQGPSGAGSIPPFSSVSDRDIFFSTPSNAPLLRTGLPVEVNIDETASNTVANFVWTGPNNPTDYVNNDQRWQVAPFQVSNGTLLVGPGLRMSNAVGSIGLEMPGNQNALSLQVLYDQNGNTKPFYPSLAAEQTLDVNLLFDAQMPDPYELQYTTFGNNLTNDFIFRAATAGTVRVRYWLGTDDTGTLIFDERRVINANELNDDITFGIGNEYLLPQGTQLFVRSEGVTLLGTVVDDPGSPFDGENLLYFRSLIQPYTEIDFMSSGDVEHPITIARDMPSDEDLTALAAASVNGNSAVWEIANDQLANSNRSTVNMTAQVSGLLDVDGNEIPTTPVASDTLQLRAGSTVRIFSNTDLRVTTSPLFESDVSQDVVFVFADLTINAANLATYNRKTIVCNFTTTQTITIAQNTNIDYFDVFVGEQGALLVETQGLERINDEVDKRFTSNQGGRIKKKTQGGQYAIVYSASNDLLLTGSSSATTTTGPTDSPTLAPLADNQQLVNQAVDIAVSTLQNTIFNSGRSFVRFNDGFTIDDSNLATFEDKNIIYTAKNDKPLDSATRPDVNLPTDADIAAAGESYPVTFEFTHLGGTVRSTTSNLVRFFFDGELIGQILRDDAAVIVKTGVGVDYEVSTGTFNPGDTILPTGVFNLKVDTPISNIATIATELSGVSIVAGDAFLVETGGSWSGLTIPDNSILVAVVNGPSLLDSATNNDWLLLDNPRVNAKSAALLANFIQDGILFSSTRNVQVDPSNVFEFSAAATGTPQTREIGANTQGSGRSITYANVPIQFADLVGGRLMINLNFNVETVTGFSPSFTSVRLQYPGGIEFTFPVNGTTNNGNYTAAIDIPNVDYTSALNQDCTLTLFYDFFGQSFFGDYTVLGVINTSKGRLHDAISSLIITESVPLETRLQTQIDAITGELGEDEASFAAIQDRISPYRNNVSLSPDVNVRYLDSTGSDNFPSVSAMTAVNPLNTEYTMGTTAVFIAVATGVEQAVMNGATQTLLTSANAQTDPNLDLGESETFEGRTYFVYRLSNQAVSDVIQTFDLTFVQVVAWQDDINTLDADVDRIDAELEHAALNLSDSLIDVLDNNVTVTEESNPTIVATEYNKSFSTNDTQTVFYEASPNAPSGGSHDSEAVSVSSSKLVVIPEDHAYSDGVILQANDGSTTTDLVSFAGGQLVANVFVPAVPSGSKTVTVHPLPATQAQRDWYSIPLHTPDLRAEADELFFTRDVPIAATTLAFQYRYDANGGHGATQTINLVIADIAVDASVSASLSLPDGESVNVGFDWQAAQRRIRVTGTPFASDPNFFIFDMEVGVTFTETRTTPATPATTRPVVIGLSRASGQDAVIATKVSAGGDLILVGNVAEVDTNYAMTTLFGAGLVGNLTVFTELGTYLNYTQFTPSAQTVVSLENHATLPQFGLFTTEYTHDTVVTFDTQLQAHNSQGDIVNLGEELVLVDSGGDRWRLSVDTSGNLNTTKLT